MDSVISTISRTMVKEHHQSQCGRGRSQDGEVKLEKSEQGKVLKLSAWFILWLNGGC